MSFFFSVRGVIFFISEFSERALTPTPTPTPQTMSFVPILVALGTSCAFELKRATGNKGPALAPDVAELKASEARLKKLMTVCVRGVEGALCHGLCGLRVQGRGRARGRAWRGAD